MHKVSLFGEDNGHDAVLTALLQRMSADSGVKVQVSSLSVTGGITRVHYEFGIYLRDIEKGRLPTPDMIVVGTDGNCKGYTTRRHEIEKVADGYPSLNGLVVYGIPDPHVERWLLADPHAFKQVLGRGCDLPQHKCQKNFYKQLLIQEIQRAGVKPLLGGLEYASDIIAAMDLPSTQQKEPSLEKIVKELKARFNQWKQQG